MLAESNLTGFEDVDTVLSFVDGLGFLNRFDWHQCEDFFLIINTTSLYASVRRLGHFCLRLNLD